MDVRQINWFWTYRYLKPFALCIASAGFCSRFKVVYIRLIVETCLCFHWSEFLYVYFPVLLCLSVSVKRLAVKTASEMTYCVSGGALNSTHSVTHWSENTSCIESKYFTGPKVVISQQTQRAKITRHFYLLYQHTNTYALFTSLTWISQLSAHIYIFWEQAKTFNICQWHHPIKSSSDTSTV